MPLQAEAQKLYKEMLRVSSQFKDPNFKAYFVRIANDDFTSKPTDAFLTAQRNNLELLKRQTTVHNMYYSEEFTARR